jgi:hypothetical protein
MVQSFSHLLHVTVVVGSNPCCLASGLDFLPSLYSCRSDQPSLTIGKYVQTHFEFSDSSDNLYLNIVCALIIHCLKIFFSLLRENIYKELRIINAALILYVGSKNAACQFVGTYCKYFLVGGKDSSTKERIYDGRTLESKWSPAAEKG